jgi:hypothetical protein
VSNGVGAMRILAGGDGQPRSEWIADPPRQFERVFCNGPDCGCRTPDVAREVEHLAIIHSCAIHRDRRITRDSGVTWRRVSD